MAIKINEIEPAGLSLELEQKLDLFKTGTASTSVKARLVLKPAGSGIIHISGRVQAEPELECSRCLKRFAYPIDSELNIDVAPISSLGNAAEHELSGGELETDFYRGDEIEPLEYVEEQLLISVPMVPLHSPACKGLCPTCGADLNERQCGCPRQGEGFGPFSALKDLFKK